MLTKLLISRFIPGAKNTNEPQVRLKYGILSGHVGIVVNLILFLLKMTVGLLSGSVAIAADAVNNLSDAGNSVIMILSFNISAKPADDGHPFGHGRVEYVAGVVVSVIVIAMGFDFLKESIFRIIHPAEVNMNPLMLWLLTGSLLLKLWLFFFYRFSGKTINSAAIQAAAADSLSDMAATAAVIIAVFSGNFIKFPIDGCAGIIAALLILINGAKVLRDTINPLLGEAPNAELVNELKSRLLQCKGIHGVHDIIIHNYGPMQYFATAHAEVDMDDDILAVHDMLESAEVEIGKHMPIHLLLHCDPYNTVNPEVKQWRVKLEDHVAKFDPKFKVYDFRLIKNNAKITLSFHMLVPRNYHIKYEEVRKALEDSMKNEPPAPELKIEFVNSYV